MTNSFASDILLTPTHTKKQRRGSLKPGIRGSSPVSPVYELCDLELTEAQPLPAYLIVPVLIG
jgi:hypothetical protein